VFTPSRLTLARQRRQLTLKALAERAGITSRTLSAFENGEYDPPAGTLEKLAEALGFPTEFFSRPEVVPLATEPVSFRSLSKMTAAERDSALSAGQLALELSRWIDTKFTLPAADVPDLREMAPEAAAAELRERWRLGERPIRNTIHTAEARGVRVFSLDVKASSVDAFSFWQGATPFVFLNTQKSGERSRFDLAHELGHLVLHRHGSPQGQQAEQAADQFASAFLMPRGAVLATAPRFVTIDGLVQLKRVWQVSAAALLVRLHRVGLVSDWQYRSLAIELSQRGYRTKEPSPIPRESSQLLTKVFGLLRTEGKGRSFIARELGIAPSELDALVFGLVISPITGGGGTPAAKPSSSGRSILRLVSRN
jgi:Zn-dependent peptidase ImmA (M78 family)/DNA-binding XRE family transcriptional regulator